MVLFVLAVNKVLCTTFRTVLKPLLLKQCFGDAIERKKFSGLSIEVVGRHTVLSRMKK